MSVPQEQMMGAPPAPPMEAEPMPQAAGATSDQAIDAMEQERMAQMNQIAAAAPQPDQPYSINVVQKFVDSMNNLLDEVDPEMPQIEFMAEGKRIDGPLPPEVFVPFVLIMGFVSTLDGAEKFMMDPSTLVNDAALRKATATIGMIMKDKGIIEKMKETPEGDMPEEEMVDEPAADAPEAAGAMPEDMSAEDEALMNRM